MKQFRSHLVLASLSLSATLAYISCSSSPRKAEPGTPRALSQAGFSENDITDAYVYLLDRYLVIRQEQAEVSEDRLGYNKIKYNDLARAGSPNSNPDVADLEAWIAVDENSCQVLNIPRTQGRYSTVQVLDEWADVLMNINPRAYPQKPYGKVAFCLSATSSPTPTAAYRIDLPSRKAKIIARIERKGSDAETKRLQHLFKLTANRETVIAPAVGIPTFTNENLIGVEAFTQPLVGEVLSSAPDPMGSSADIQKKAYAIAAYVGASPANRSQVDRIIRERSIPDFKRAVSSSADVKNGWTGSARFADGFWDNYTFRTMTSYARIWWNIPREMTVFDTRTDANGNPLRGDQTYLIRFALDGLPQAAVNAFWSATVSNGLKRSRLSSSDSLTLESDGTLVIAVGARPKGRTPSSNWIPGPKDGQPFSVTFRMYAPKDEVLNGWWSMPPVFLEARPISAR